MKHFNPIMITAALAVSFGLTACLPEDNNDGSSSSSSSNRYIETTIDASSHTEWKYVDLDTNDVVGESDDWDVAFKRTGIMINEETKTALIAEQSDFYDTDGDAVTSAFVNAVSDDEVDQLLASINLSDFTFSKSSEARVMDAESEKFYDYNSTTHILTANDDALWVIRSSEGDAYATFRPTKLYDSGAGEYNEATFELHIQGSEDTGFSDTATTWTVAMPSGSAKACYDIDTAASVDCSSEGWDIEFDFNPSAYVFTLRLNGGSSGDGSAAAVSTGAYDNADAANLTAGIQDPDGDDFDITSYHYSQDSETTAFSENSWYAYAVNGGHGIWPNYRVYGVETSEDTHLIQIINYYSSTNESAHITYRYVTL